MDLSINQRRKLKQTWILVGVGTLVGPFYIIFSDGFDELAPFVVGAVAGFLISCTIAYFEIWALTKGIRKMRFITLVVVRTFLYLTIIFLITFNVIVVKEMIIGNQSYAGVIGSTTFQKYLFHEDFKLAMLYGVTLALSINFTRMLSRKMGQGMLLSHITGTYFTPVREERIIMFLNVSNSKIISEKLGPLDFHKFLNELFYDIAEPIIHRRGIIYEYVEDLVVISWAMNKGLSDSNCIRVFFDIVDTIESKKEIYFNSFGFIPKLRAAAHCGHLLRAEIGDIKTHISFQGDVMNTTSRVLGYCYSMKLDLLISAHLSYRLSLPPLFTSESVGSIELRGKEKSVELFRIEETTIGDII